MASRLGRFFRYLRAHRLALGFLAALAPLGILLALQVIWLTDLDRASTLAHRAVLRGSLEAVGGEVRHFYRSTAERLLNVPSALLESEELAGLGEYWSRAPRGGVRTLFAVTFKKSATGDFLTFDPRRNMMVPTPSSDEALAIVLASMPWQRWTDGPNPLQPGDELALHVNEQNPEHRIILEPIASADGGVLGLVGFILDEDYARKTLIPRVVDEVLPRLFPESRPAFRLTDGRGRTLAGEKASASSHQVSQGLPFVLRDWALHIASDGPSTRWLSGSLAWNLTLGFALALALLSGLALALVTARDAMRLSEMKSDFVSNVSHELRTPLASIRLFAEMMTMGRVKSPDKVIEYGSYIEAESRRLSRLIDNILDFSRIESEQKEYRREPTDVLEVVERVLRAFTVRLEQSGLRLVRRLPEAPGPTAHLDEDAVGQALHNLLDNAAKYSSGAEEVEVSMDDREGYVVISIKDHGIGIAKADQPRVFERFHRVSTGLVHDVKGSGLGLSIVQHTARAHGGRVTLESEIGEGSTFSLWLPRCKEF
ncbi:MAG: HAMP domain-containing sensor histidine kinase [Myxococcota bacterium]